MTEKKKKPFGLVLLLVLLLLGIIITSTVLVGRALGWWDYADLPVVGRFFPKPATTDPTPDEELDAEAKIEKLQREIEHLLLEIDQREQQANDLRNSLRRQEARVAELMQEAESFEQQILDERAKKADAELAQTAKIYANMRAQEAAQVLEQMNTEDVRSILYLMPPETAGAILGNMKPEKAAQIASIQVER